MDPQTRNGASDESVADLTRRLSEQTTELVRKEIELAKAELQVKGKKAGIGAGMFGGAGLFGIFTFACLTATFILALATAVAPWLAALIVTAIYGAITGVFALQGKNKVQEATPPVSRNSAARPAARRCRARAASFASSPAFSSSARAPG